MKSAFLNKNKQEASTGINAIEITERNAFSEGLMYTDKQVLATIKSEKGASQRITNWFFETARSYAFNQWKGKYPRLDKVDWDEVFASVNSTLTIRVKKEGWHLRKASLKTYYTELVRYAILDYLQPNKNSQVASLTNTEQKPIAPILLETEERVEGLTKFLLSIVNNTAQVQVLLLVAKGFSHQEIAAEERVIYSSVSSSINAYAKALNKIKKYLIANPKDVKRLKNLLRT